MANDKDFVVAGAVEVGKDTKVTLGTVTSNNIDLATGNYFADTPTGASTYTISNAGDVQSFQLEVTGGTAEVAQNFSTTLYTGNGGSTTTITNNIDLLGDGGLVWIKARNAAESHGLFDTERGVTKLLSSNTTSAETTNSGTLTDFYSNGFKVDGNGIVGSSTDPYVSWTFKKEPSFFDVVTYTGTGVARTISHNLGSEVGTLIIKRLGNVSGWSVYHRSTGATSALELDSTGAVSSGAGAWNSTAPTTTEFSINSYDSVNSNGDTYVAYLFAHDDAADGLIQCGSYTGNGGSGVNSINLGWKPQWILLKNASATGSWAMYDTVRGWVDSASDSDDARLFANSTGTESLGNAFGPTATGFEFKSGNLTWNNSGNDFVYIAIRAASDLDITWPSSIEWASGSAPSAPATGETDVFTLSTDDGGTTYTGIKSIDNAS